MNVLISGGTVSPGRHLTDAMVRCGHTVTHFNRDRTAPGGFPGIERLRGHRERDLADWSCLPEKFRWLYAASNRKAVEAGLTFRPVGETARDMAAWLSQKMPLDGSDRLDPEGERGIPEDRDRARAGVQGGIDAAAGRLPGGRDARDGFGV